MEKITEETNDQSLELNRSILRQIADLYKAGGQDDQNAKTSQHKTRCFLSSSPIEQSEDLTKTLSLYTIGQIVHHPVNFGYQKATVMVIGNISAGKSTFINWFVQEAVQKTGMAIETSGFTFVTAGRCVTEIGGESTLALRPHLKTLTDKYPGFLQNLSLKTCPGTNERLRLIDIVDTPGLADGELQYPFDVEKIIVEMASCVDLFLVFFDPIGQALGRRVLSVVEKLTDQCPDKVRFCLTKIDQIRTEEERIKVMCQTTQSLTAKIKSRHGFDLIPIYIPGAAEGTYFLNQKIKEERGIVNRLYDLVEDIQRSTEHRVQNALNGLCQDINVLTSKVDKLLLTYRKKNKELELYEVNARRRLFARIILFMVAGIFAALHLRVAEKSGQGIPSFSIMLWLSFMNPIVLDKLEWMTEYLTHDILSGIWVVLFLSLLCTVTTRGKPCIPSEDKTLYIKLNDCKKFLRSVKIKWKTLNKTYLNHAMAEHSDTTNTLSETLPLH